MTRGPHLGSEEDVVSRLDAQHERVVLIADLVLVAAEAAARPDAGLPQPRQRLLQSAIPRQAGRGVAVLQPPAYPSLSILIPICAEESQLST